MQTPLNSPKKQDLIRPRLALIMIMLILTAAAVPMLTSSSGLDHPTPVGAFLDGQLPSTTPSGVSSWSTLVAWPNLEFTDPIELHQLPSMNKFLMGGKQGHIWTFSEDTTTAIKDTLLDISDSVYTAGDAGLLGVVLHPEFGQVGSPNNQYIYVFYRYAYVQGVQRPKAYCRLSRFTVDLTTLKSHDSTEFVLIQQYDRHDWHNGGGMFFGTDGFLYLTVGDEGGANDAFNTAQQIDVGLLSGILRIDVDQDPSRSHPIRRQPLNPASPPSGWPGSYSQGYYVPNDNPWQSPDSSHLEEFWAVGLRSPHRMTYDALSNTIWIGDIGQGSREEITVLGKAENAQWPYMEGNRVTGQAQPSPLIGIDKPPIFDYPRSTGTCVIGGFVYRGTKYPSLYGKYLFGDHTRRKIWYLDYDLNNWTSSETYMATVPAFGQGGKSGISHFSTDDQGEVYVLKLFGTNLNGGKIYKLRAENPTPEPPAKLSDLGIFTNLATLTPADFMIPYSLNEPFWSDAALKSRWMILPNDSSFDSASEQIEFDANGDWNFPQGAVMVKHFEMEMDESDPAITQRLETRLLVKGSDDGFYGVTYKWRDDQSDADLLSVSKIDTLAIATPKGPRELHWYYPGRQECLFCHNNGAKSVLGPKTRQLNGDHFYAQTGRTANQLYTLSSLNIFDAAPDTTDLGSYLTSAAKDDNSASLELRARTYLDANCAYCHRPNTSVQANFDARLSTDLSDQGLIYGSLISKFGLHDPRVIVPGDLEHSLLYQRMVAVHNQLSMPPLAKNLMDTAGVQLLADWIMEIDTAITTSADMVVADYRDDFQGVNPAAGWEYLWNSGGPIGNDANYQALLWNGTQYDSDGSPGIPDPTNLAWGQLNGNGGHPGRALNQGQTTSRFVIAGFTIQHTGTYEIQNSLVEDANTGCGDGAEVQVYVDNTLIQTVTYPNGGSATFDVSLGTLSAGDKVYICHGPKDTGDGCDGFSWDFSIRQQSVSKGQRIFFDPLPSQHTSAVPFSLTAYSSSSLPLTYTVIEGPASVSGQTVTLTGQPGEVVIRAEQNGNGNYLPAPAVERRFWVTPNNTGIGSGLLATYFHNMDFTLVADFRVDPVIDFKWGSGAPLPSMEYNTYSVVWEGEIEPPATGSYTFTTSTDDGVRLYINNQLIIDHWQDQAVTPTTGQINLNAWVRVPIRMEYYEKGVYAEARLEWSGPDVDLTVVPQRFLYPASASSFPVELLSFTGDLRENQVWLNWETLSELESDYFAIEKAYSGSDFQEIGKVSAAGNSQELRRYQFIDPQPQQGMNYYRLRQVDVSGVETYSETVQIYFDGEYMSLYPNPVNQAEGLHLHLHLAESRQAHAQLWSTSGQLAWEQKETWAEGPQRHSIPTDQLASGTYLFVLNVGDKRWTEKVIIR